MENKLGSEPIGSREIYKKLTLHFIQSLSLYRDLKHGISEYHNSVPFRIKVDSNASTAMQGILLLDSLGLAVVENNPVLQSESQDVK